MAGASASASASALTHFLERLKVPCGPAEKRVMNRALPAFASLTLLFALGIAGGSVARGAGAGEGGSGGDSGLGTFSSPMTSNSGSEYAGWTGMVYVDPDIHYATITREPGHFECKVNPDACVAWPDSRSDLTRVPGVAPMEQTELDLGTGKTKTTTYLKVRYNYDRRFKRKDGSEGTMTQSGTGWIDASVLRREKLDPIYEIAMRPEPGASAVTPHPSPDKAGCKPPERPAGQDPRPKPLKELKERLQASHLEQLEAAVRALGPHVGNCPLKPATEKRLDRWSGHNIYDTEVLPQLRADRTAIRSVIQRAGQQHGKDHPLAEAGFDDIVAVDTLARTIYSEMNGCFAQGLQYPMAAAKVALNRARLAQSGRAPAHFVSGSHAREDKPVLSKVLTAPFQFSVWNELGARNPRDKTILMSLCPTKDESGRANWKGAPPTPADTYAWNMALKIATEAVLFPQEFERKTASVKQTYYTSGMTSYQGRKKPVPPPTILGRRVDSLSCMYLWEGK